MQHFNMGGVPPIIFGPGRIDRVAKIVNTHGGGRVLVIADSILSKLGMCDRLAEILVAADIQFEMAADVFGEPKLHLIDQLAEQARAVGARVIVGFGGGAAMDAAKVVATIAPSGQQGDDFALAVRPLPTDGLPAIAIPTTAGTGSEVTRTAVISKSSGAKIWFWGEELMYKQAVLDPELTLSLPPEVTAWTGIDAVAHALEAVTSRSASPAGNLYGLEALRILTESLPRAVEDGSDMHARSRVLWASTIAGLALHNCNTHLGHNISHALGSLVRIHHGRATGLALETSLPWLVKRSEGAENYASAALAMGAEQTAEALPDVFSKLMRSCRIPAALPVECSSISPTALATEMQKDANIGMAKNAACKVDAEDFEELASLVLERPSIDE
ncbi:MAG: iron-containing alcohol dehydrogenase [Pseudomonadota bacterium]